MFGFRSSSAYQLGGICFGNGPKLIQIIDINNQPAYCVFSTGADVNVIKVHTISSRKISNHMTTVIIDFT